MVLEKPECSHGIRKAGVYLGNQKSQCFFLILRQTETPECTQHIRKDSVVLIESEKACVNS